MGDNVKKRDRACAKVGKQCLVLDYQWTFLYFILLFC